MGLFKKSKWDKRSSADPSDLGTIDFLLTETDESTSYVEVKKAIEVIPDWYKDLAPRRIIREGDLKDDFTIKRCIPVLDALTTGYYLVTKYDITFKYDEERGWCDLEGNFNPNKPEVSMHPVQQLGSMPFSPEFSKYAYKWDNPFTIKTPPGYSVMFTHPVNAPYLPFYTLSGVVDTDMYFQPVLFPFLSKNNFNGVLPAGTPIVQIIPFKRDDWKSEVYTDGMSREYVLNRSQISEAYESQRYDKDGNAMGGMYKRDYRKKKKYL